MVGENVKDDLHRSLAIVRRQVRKLAVDFGEEFRQMYGEYQMGKPLEKVLQETRDRLKSENPPRALTRIGNFQPVPRNSRVITDSPRAGCR